MEGRRTWWIGLRELEEGEMPRNMGRDREMSMMDKVGASELAGC